MYSKNQKYPSFSLSETNYFSQSASAHPVALCKARHLRVLKNTFLKLIIQYNNIAGSINYFPISILQNSLRKLIFAYVDLIKIYVDINFDNLAILNFLKKLP